jgi:hypothetical protein
MDSKTQDSFSDEEKAKNLRHIEELRKHNVHERDASAKARRTTLCGQGSRFPMQHSGSVEPKLVVTLFKCPTPTPKEPECASRNPSWINAATHSQLVQQSL